MSWMLQQSLASQAGQAMALSCTIPLQKVALSIFWQLWHLSLSLSLMGEISVCINLLGATSSMQSTGFPSETAKVENRNWGWQLSSLCPSGEVTRRQSIVFLTKAILSTRVQYYSGIPTVAPYGDFTIMLSWSKVYCKIEDCRRSPSVENKAVLLVLKKILVSRTEELDSISMLLLPQTDGYLSFYGVFLVMRPRLVSGERGG